jgi:hypothetical protein
MIVELQELTGSPEAAGEAFLGTLKVAGAQANVPAQATAPEMDCDRYVTALRGTQEGATAPALQLGTAEWTIADAVAFAHALGKGDYKSVGDRVLAVMRLSKERSPEQEPGEYTVSTNSWGAGDAFEGWSPAYKSGWGGARHQNFLVAQYVVLNRNGHVIAVAAAFHPRSQPEIDDPGRTKGPDALEAVFGEVRAEIEHRYGP